MTTKPTKRQSSLPPHIARLYGTARWRKRRAQQLNTEPLCAACKGEGILAEATVADHIDRATDEQSFWSGRLQSLCSTHHQAKRQAESQGNDWSPGRGGCDASGMPTDPGHHWRNG